MRSRTIHKTIRTLCAAGVLAAASSEATIVSWQLGPNGNVGPSKDLSVSAFWDIAHGFRNSGANTTSQLSFRNSAESGTGATEAMKTAALNEKLQARDTDFQEAAPSTILSAQMQSTAQAVRAFDTQFAAVSSFRFAATALSFGSAPGTVGTSAAGDPVPVPEMSALFPIVGLIVAVSCTRILRRRRAAQLSTNRSLV